jgi:uncharacterized protein YbaR (Trm112 family)
MVSEELLEILRCPYCVQDREGMLKLVKETWLVCQEPQDYCGRKYPILDDIPVMLIDEGDKWIDTAEEDLPVPPPER